MEKLVKWLNKNLPLLGSGTIMEFNEDICRQVIRFARKNHPDFCAWVTGFVEEDKGISMMIEFLADGGLDKHDRLAGLDPTRELSYDSLMCAANALIRAAGGDTNPIPRNESFVRTRYTQYLDQMDDCHCDAHGHDDPGYDDEKMVITTAMKVDTDMVMEEILADIGDSCGFGNEYFHPRRPRCLMS